MISFGFLIYGLVIVGYFLSFAAGVRMSKFLSTDFLDGYVTGFKHGATGNYKFIEEMPQALKDKYEIKINYDAPTDNSNS